MAKHDVRFSGPWQVTGPRGIEWVAMIDGEIVRQWHGPGVYDGLVRRVKAGRAMRAAARTRKPERIPRAPLTITRAPKSNPDVRCCWVCGLPGGAGFTSLLRWAGYDVPAQGVIAYAHPPCARRAQRRAAKREATGGAK